MEISAFLNYIESRDIIHPNKSRHWFDSTVYETEALMRTIVSGRSRVEKALISWFNEVFSFSEVAFGILPE